jgi:hypothetical protein
MLDRNDYRHFPFAGLVAARPDRYPVARALEAGFEQFGAAVKQHCPMFLKS